jgi:alkylation response protein AidB-like acyl-CoA dehydrogenase
MKTQKREYLPRIASGELRLQAFAVTEPGSGTATTGCAPSPGATATAVS